MPRSVLSWCVLVMATCLSAPVFAQADPAADKPAEAAKAEAQAKAEAAKAEAQAKAAVAKKKLAEARASAEKAAAEARKAQAAAEQARLEAAKAQHEFLISNLDPQKQGGVNLGKWWIGVGCAPAPEALAAQLGLAEGEGLVVDDVVDDSPAKKAGLAKHDLLLQVGDKKLQSVQDLVDAVQAADGKEISVKLYRGGKEQTLQVTPAERPQDQLGIAFTEAVEGVNPGEFEVFAQGFPDGGVHVFRPGIIYGQDDANQPKNLSITITRKDKDKKGEILVIVDGKTYKATEDSLQQLPDSVREHVRSLMAGGGMRRAGMARLAMPGQMGGMGHWTAGRPVGAPGIEQQLKELEAKIDALQKAVDALSGARPEGAAK